MRLKHGGFTPRVSGRPVDDVTSVSLPKRLVLDLVRKGVKYEPVVAEGQEVLFGEPLAELSAAGGTLVLPAPASGMVRFSKERLFIEGPRSETTARGFAPQAVERTSAETVKETLARGGIWPFIFSSHEQGVPNLQSADRPHAIAANFILAEPFRARGKVIITRSWSRIMAGIRFLHRLLSDYGTIEVILTDKSNPVARMMYDDLKGFAWVRFHSVPLTYPIENPRVLSDALRMKLPNKGKDAEGRDEDIWVIDAQGIEAIGACLGEGLPLHERVVVTGGPAEPDPRHFAVRIGTPLEAFITSSRTDSTLLRGGLLTGVPVGMDPASVGYDDDAFFSLPRRGKQEFLGFVRPGFAKTSYSHTFAGDLFGVYDRTIPATLRGERRACISCGFCETVCPAGIMPQIIHRYLYRERYEEAERAGLDRCVDCNLCTYVCPSKIELRRQFSEAKEFIRKEREEMLAVASRASGNASAGEDK